MPSGTDSIEFSGNEDVSSLYEVDENYKITTADEELARKAHEVGEDALAQTAYSTRSKIPPLKHSPQASPKASEVARRNFPNATAESIKFGLLTEAKMVNGQGGLNEIRGRIEALQDKSKELLRLQQKITKLAPEDKSLPVTDEIRAHLTSLKEKFGIDLIAEDEKEISVAKLANIKTVLDNLKTQVQTDTQKEFMDIQTTTQMLNALLDSLKMIIKYSNNLMSTITQHMSR